MALQETMMTQRIFSLILSLAIWAPAGVIRAQTPDVVDLELILAIDVSGSIDETEAALQRQGYLKAFADPRVLQAIVGGQHKKIAVMYFEWASYNYQRTIVDWSIISDPATADAFVRKLEAQPISTERWTSISGAIEYAMKRFAASPYRGARRALDISGDGRNNNGRDLSEVRAEALAQGIVINGLPIVNDRPTRWGTPPERDLDIYYRDYVIGGPDSFYIIADGFASFSNAILAKLVREIAEGSAPSFASHPTTLHPVFAIALGLRQRRPRCVRWRPRRKMPRGKSSDV